MMQVLRFVMAAVCIYHAENEVAAKGIGAVKSARQPNDSIPEDIEAPANYSLLEQTERENGFLSLNVGRRGGRGKARSDYDCTVRTVPYHVRRQMGLHSFYQKYAHAYGVPIISSNRVQNAAIERACYVVRFALADRKDIRDWLHDRYGRAGVIAERERTTDIPEHSYLPDWWNRRARGLGATLSKPISTGGEENLLCRPSDRYYGGGRGEDIFLHEFAHAIHNLGVTGAIPNFDRRIRYWYNQRKRDGRWARTYFMSTDREFFAEGVTSYFDVNTETRDGRPNGIHNHVNTRKELKAHDLQLYKLVKEVFPCGNKFLDRCSAKRGAKPPPFRMNCKDDGGTVVTSKPKPKPTTYPTPPLPTTSKGCVDLNHSCPSWAKDRRKYCTHNHYVMENCKRSCQTCKSKKGLIDKDTKCSTWAEFGYCKSNSYVKKNCKKSCQATSNSS